MQTLSTFPILTDELVQKIRLQTSPFRFFYTGDDGEEHELTAEDTTASTHPLTDEHGRWSADTGSFGFSRTLSIRSASFLFGSNGLCCKDAGLGLALIWKSPDSRQRSAINIGTVENTPAPQSFQCSKSFPKPKFRGKLELETVLVVLKAGHPGPDEGHLANIPGTVLGTIDRFSVLFDGSGSSFPVMISPDKDGLLWSVSCDFDDPLTDKFNDCISINLNSAHKDYKYINPSDKSHYNSSFLREVLANALSTIVDYVRESDYWDDIKNGKGEEESVGQAIFYFAKTLNLNLDDARQCSIAFREYFEQKLGEI